MHPRKVINVASYYESVLPGSKVEQLSKDIAVYGRSEEVWTYGQPPPFARLGGLECMHKYYRVEHNEFIIARSWYREEL